MARGLMPEGPAAGAAPPQGGAPAGGAPSPTPGQNGQGRRATEEEKGLYREFLGNIVNAIYEEETAEAVGEIIRGATQAPQGAAAAGGAVEPLAHIVSGAVARVAYSGLDEGLPITREMAAAAAASMAADLGRNMAESVGVPPLPDDQIQAVYLRSMELLADQRDQGQAEAAEGAPPGEAGTEPTPTAQPGNGLMTPRQQPNRRARRAAAAQQRRRQ